MERWQLSTKEVARYSVIENTIEYLYRGKYEGFNLS